MGAWGGFVPRSAAILFIPSPYLPAFEPALAALGGNEVATHGNSRPITVEVGRGAICTRPTMPAAKSIIGPGAMASAGDAAHDWTMSSAHFRKLTMAPPSRARPPTSL